MTAWDVAMVWIVWNIVMPACGIVLLVVVLALIQWWADGSRRKP